MPSVKLVTLGKKILPLQGVKTGAIFAVLLFCNSVSHQLPTILGPWDKHLEPNFISSQTYAGSNGHYVCLRTIMNAGTHFAEISAIL